MTKEELAVAATFLVAELRKEIMCSEGFLCQEKAKSTADLIYWFSTPLQKTRNEIKNSIFKLWPSILRKLNSYINNLEIFNTNIYLQHIQKLEFAVKITTIISQYYRYFWIKHYLSISMLMTQWWRNERKGTFVQNTRLRSREAQTHTSL